MEKATSFNRRDFIRVAIGASASLPLIPLSSCSNKVDFSHRVIRIHNSQATRQWDYAANSPWDHTVETHQGHEGKIKERYFDYINEEVVADMLDRGLRELTGEPAAAKAWRALLPGLSGDDKISIKMNLNNASFDEKVTTNRMDQTIPLVNAVLDDLVNELQLKEGNITLLDRTTYEQRWHEIYEAEKEYFENMLRVFKRAYLQLGKSRGLVDSKQGRLVPIPMRVRYPRFMGYR